MKFALLPNEIINECLACVIGVCIFKSFDQLNYRFNKLIRNIPLHAILLDTRKLLGYRFCHRMTAGKLSFVFYYFIYALRN